MYSLIVMEATGPLLPNESLARAFDSSPGIFRYFFPLNFPQTQVTCSGKASIRAPTSAIVQPPRTVTSDRRRRYARNYMHPSTPVSAAHPRTRCLSLRSPGHQRESRCSKDVRTGLLLFGTGPRRRAVLDILIGLSAGLRSYVGQDSRLLEEAA
jgi:hypothetical protein